jgi:hypothetical protein
LDKLHITFCETPFEIGQEHSGSYQINREKIIGKGLLDLFGNPVGSLTSHAIFRAKAL